MRGKSVDISECNYPVVDMHKNKKIQKRAEEEMLKNHVLCQIHAICFRHSIGDKV